MSSPRVVRLTLLAALAGCAGPAPAFVVESPTYRVEVTRRHVHAPGDLGRLEAFVAAVEPAHAALERVFAREVPGGTIRLDGPMIDARRGVVAFGEVAGIHVAAEDLIVLREPDRATLLHELAHRFCARSWRARLPRWVDEGLARALAARLSGESLLVHVMALRHLQACGLLPATRAITDDVRTAEPLDVFVALLELPVLPGASVEDTAAAVIMDRLLRDEGGPETPGSAARAVARARSLDPDEAAAVLERAALSGFPGPDDVRDALVTEQTDSALLRLFPDLDLDLASTLARDDAVARRRLALWLRAPGATRQGVDRELEWLLARLADPAPEVVCASAYALGARGDRRALPVLIAELERLPWATFGGHGELLPVQPMLIELAGGRPDGVPAVLDAFGGWEWDDEGMRLRPDLIAGWRAWWASRE